MCKSFVNSYHHPERDEPDLVESTVTLYKLVHWVGHLVDLFGITILTFLFSTLNCSYYEDAPPTLDIDPTIICWRHHHIILAACAITTIIPLFLWIVIIKIADPEDGMDQCYSCCCEAGGRWATTGDDHIQIHYRWAYHYAQLKVIIAAGNAFFSHHTYIRLSILLVCDSLILLLASVVNVNQLRKHNILRRITIVGAKWTVVCGFIAQKICDPSQWTSFAVWVVGLVILLICAIIIFKRMPEEPESENCSSSEESDSDRPLLVQEVYHVTSPGTIQ